MTSATDLIRDRLTTVPDFPLPAGSRILVLDDVLATGGTIGASVALIERAGWHVAGISVVMEIAELGGRTNLGGRDIHALATV